VIVGCSDFVGSLMVSPEKIIAGSILCAVGLKSMI